MAFEAEEKEVADLLSTNLNDITAVVTIGGSLQWFANSLVKRSFITREVAQGILYTDGIAPDVKANRLMDGVFAVIQISDRKGYWFDKFVSIFSNGTSASHACLVEKLKPGVTSAEVSAHSRPSSAALPPAVDSAPDTSSELLSSVDHTTTGLQPTHPTRSTHQPSTSFWSLEKVKATIDELEMVFAGLHAEAGFQIGKKETEDIKFLEKFRSRLLLLPIRRTHLHGKFFKENEKDISKAEDTKTILVILCRYVDYRNYEVFSHVVKFCAKPLQEEMSSYCKELKEFEMRTTVDVYICAIPEEANKTVKEGFSKMAIKINKPESQCTLHEVRELNKEIIENSTLCSHSVYIGAVSANCVVVRLAFPSNAVGCVLSAITPELMSTHHVTEVAVNERNLSILQEKKRLLVR